MKGLLFLSRVALICNVLFVVSFVLQRTPDPGLPQAIVSTIVLLGWLLSGFINFAVVVAYLINAIRKKNMGIPSWLIITNILFLIAEILIQIVFA